MGAPHPGAMGKLASPILGDFLAFSSAATALQLSGGPPELLELGPDAFAEAFPHLAGDSQQLQHLQDQLPADLDIPGMEELLSWLDAVEPQDAFPDVPSSPVLSRFLSQLPDLSEDIEEPSTQGLAASGALGQVPSTPGVHPEKVGGGLSVQSPVVPAVSPLLSSVAGPLLRALRRALPKPPLSPLKSPVDLHVVSALRRALPKPRLSPLKSPVDLQVLRDLRRPLPNPPLSPLKTPPAAPAPTGTKLGAKRPAPTSTPSTAQSSQHRRPTEETPAKDRKMLLGSTARAGDAAPAKEPAGLRLPATGGHAQWEPLPTQPRMLQPPAQPRVDYVPCVGPWAGGDAAPTPLEEQEESVPITPQQRPERERLKKLAQEERQRAAHQMKIGPVQFIVQRQKDRAIAKYYGYP